MANYRIDEYSRWSYYKDTEYSEILRHKDLVISTAWDSITDSPNSIIFGGIVISKDHLKETTDESTPTLEYYCTKQNALYKVYLNERHTITSWHSHSYGKSKPVYTLKANDLTRPGYSNEALPAGFFVFDELLYPDENGYAMTVPSTSSQDLLGSYGAEQIRGRYVFTDRPSSGLSNILVDSFLPRLLYVYDLSIAALADDINLPKTSYAISPLVADILTTNRMPIEDIIAYYGYDLKSMKRLLTEVKRKKLNFIFAGLGGTGMNTVYWLDALCKATNVVNLFNKVVLYEKESVELSNILRFPLPLSDYYNYGSSGNKIVLARPYANRLSSGRLEENYRYLDKRDVKYDYEFFDTQDRNNPKARPTTIIYGAPSLEIRNELSGLGNFICATHAANECSLWLNPRQEDELAIETYGLIQLAPFFMNQVKLVIETLKLLASDQDLQEQDKHIMDSEFDGTSTGRLSRVYNWQIIHNPLVLTDQQAMNI